MTVQKWSLKQFCNSCAKEQNTAMMQERPQRVLFKFNQHTLPNDRILSEEMAKCQFGVSSRTLHAGYDHTNAFGTKSCKGSVCCAFKTLFKRDPKKNCLDREKHKKAHFFQLPHSFRSSSSHCGALPQALCAHRLACHVLLLLKPTAAL
jgi:hypothetical protein